MLKNYFKIAWRNLKRNKLYSAINIGGLAVGMSVSFILLLFVVSEIGYDRFHEKKDRLYRVLRNQPRENEILTGSSTPVPLAAALLKDIPEIKQATRTSGRWPHLLKAGDKSIKKEGFYTDPAFFTMFGFKLIKGQANTVFTDVSSIVINESTAKALFGNNDPINQLIKLDENETVKVTGVIQDAPDNSSIRFQCLLPWALWEKSNPWLKESGWGNFSFDTYVELNTAASATEVNKKIKEIVGRYNEVNKESTLFIQPISQWHLYSEFKHGVSTGGGRIEYVRLFMILALGILLIACINFMNLATARSEKRAREVGIRKVVGAERRSIISQFLGESVFMALLSLIIATLLVYISLPYFNTLTGKQLHIPFNDPVAWGIVLGITLCTGLIAGSYPAFFLSSFLPVKVLKGKLKIGKGALRPRQILVVAQFAFATALILCTILIYRQINYISNRPVGYDRNNLVEMELDGVLYEKFDLFRQQVIASGAAVAGNKNSQGITNNGSSSWGIRWPGQKPGEEKIPIDQIATTWHFTATYQIPMVAGRDFSPDRPADSNAVLLNESAVKLMRLKDPVGQTIYWQGRDRVVTGVFKDFVWGSPYEPTQAMIVGFISDWAGTMAFRLNPSKSTSESLSLLEKVYKQFNPDHPFEYHFTDEAFAAKFKTEKLLATLSNWFAGLAIFISCLGLFGLSAFSAEQRTKEIGIRKVLGASVPRLWFNLSNEFLVLVIVSFIIGAPVAWYFMNNWLSQYTYHIPIGAGVFVFTALIAIFISLLTISFQAIKAATENPIKSLKNE